MDYFVYKSNFKESPWAIYCPNEQKYLYVKHLTKTVESETVVNATQFLKDNYDINTMIGYYSLKVTGQLIKKNDKLFIVKDNIKYL